MTPAQGLGASHSRPSAAYLSNGQLGALPGPANKGVKADGAASVRYSIALRVAAPQLTP